MRDIDGVLCDLDGTLVDSEQYHLGAWNALLERNGHHPPPDWNHDCIGLPDTYACEKTWRLYPDMRRYPNLLQMKQEAFRELIARHGAGIAFPGIARRLAELRAAGVKLAVGTNSIMQNTRATLAATGLAEFFPVVVTIDTVARGKPFPDIYATAAERLGLAPERCAVIEDSTAGLESAKAAGCLALGVTTTWPAERLALADRIFDSTASAMAWALTKKVGHA